MSGDRDEEFTAFVAARLPALRRVAYLLCQDWHHADDLVQSSITRLYVHWGRARQMEHTEAYVRTIIVREFLGERRRFWAGRVTVTGEPPERAAWEADREQALDVEAALAALPPRQRATLVLRYHCDLPVEQVAHILGCTAGTVKSQSAKALAALRRALEPSFPVQAASWRAAGPSPASDKEIPGHG